MTIHQQTFDRCAATIEASFSAAPARRAADAALYLAHIEGAAPLRRLAEASGLATSTVHRAVRRVEALRDDPLIDSAFDALGDAARRALSVQTETGESSMANVNSPSGAASAAGPGAAEQASAYALRVAARVLERLSEPESFLMVARGADKAGVFCRKNKFRRPLSLLTTETASELAARDWVRCVSRTAASAKYAITPEGRAWLRRTRAEQEAQAAPEVERLAAPSAFAAQHMQRGERAVARADGSVGVIRVNLAESPLGWLATRKGADGAPFLTPEEVEAGERLRTDFETAQMGPRVTQDWRNFLTPRDSAGVGGGPAEGPTFARERVGKALADLGPGLADVALRACCFLEGLEATERRMGWAARSGKVVLKIALQRLATYYGLVRQAG